MPNVKFIASEPNDGSYLEAITKAYGTIRPTEIMAAVAYATHKGTAELIGRLRGEATWEKARKRWLIGIDFCRSDPIALDELNALPKSNVRIHDGAFVVGRNGCCPKVSFHPKLYAFRRDTAKAVVVGSGNLSRTGLCAGLEAGAVAVDPPVSTFLHVESWFDRQWQSATPLSKIAADYEAQFRAVDHRKHPMPTDDDAAPALARTGRQLTPLQLRKLNVCKHLWIEAGNLHKNRGPSRPGNQLMLKRNSRVFFGFPAMDLSVDTTLGHVAIEYGGTVQNDCSLRFSNNTMDVLTLPMPETGGQTEYDQKTLCFEQVGLRKFCMTVGHRREVSLWKQRSKAVGGNFRMSNGGREWGVF